MLYYYWTRHGIRPSVIYNLPPGELLVIRAFYEHERADVNETLRKNTKVFPVVDILQLSR